MSQYQQLPGPPLPARDHPQSTTVLVLGICSLAVCGVLGPVAWIMGNRVVQEIDASYGALGGREQANVGRILGIVGTVVTGLGLLMLVVFLLVPLLIAIGSGTAA